MINNRDELLNENVMSLFLKLAIPAILIGIVVSLYNFVDAIIVGQFIGPEAVAAVSLSYVLSMLNWAVAFFMGIGSMSVLSRTIGAKRWDIAEKIPGNLLTFNIIVSSSLTVITFLFSGKLLSLVGGTGSVLALSESYIRIICLGYVFASNAMGLNFLLRGEGRMKEALLIVGASNGMNIVLDYLLVGPLGYGIEGAAIATVVSQTMFFAIMILYFISDNKSVRISGIGISKELFSPIAKVGVSAMLLMIILAFQQAMLLRLMDNVGNSSLLIVMSATMRLFTFLPVFAKGISEGMQPAIGVAYGANDMCRVRSILRGFTIYGSLLILVPYAILMAFPSQILGMFITDSTIVAQGYSMVRVFFSAFVLYVVLFNINYYYIAIGRGKESLSFVLITQVVLFCTMAAVMPLVLGTDGIWYIVPVADVLSLFIGMLMIRNEGTLAFLQVSKKQVKHEVLQCNMPLHSSPQHSDLPFNHVQH